MDKAPLKLQFPSDISAAFCATLKENDIKYTPKLERRYEFRTGDMGFIVNSTDLKEIAIALIESKAFWGCLGSAIWAFTKRNSRKTIFVEKDGYKFKATGMSQDELAKSLENAKSLIVTAKNNDDRIS